MSDDKLLYQAVMKGDFASARKLLDRGAKPTWRNGDSALHISLARGDRNIWEMLLHHGADIHAKSFTGMTPLICAAQANEADAVKMLVERGADVNHASLDGGTSLTMAAELGNLAAAKVSRWSGRQG